MKRIIPVCFFNLNAEVIFLHSISAGHREKWTNVGEDALFLCSFFASTTPSCTRFTSTHYFESTQL